VGRGGGAGGGVAEEKSTVVPKGGKGKGRVWVLIKAWGKEWSERRNSGAKKGGKEKGPGGGEFETEGFTQFWLPFGMEIGVKNIVFGGGVIFPKRGFGGPFNIPGFEKKRKE